MIDTKKVQELNYDHHSRMSENCGSFDQARNDEINRLDNDSMRRLLQGVPEASKVLELGSASGGQWPVIQERFEDVSGLDLYEPFVKQAQAAGKNIKLGFVEDMPFKSATFDLVVSRHVMEHVGDLVKGLSDIMRVLKVGGFAAAVTPHYFPDPEPAHVNQYRLDQWIAIYTAFGFEIVEAEVRHYNCEEAHIVARKTA